MPDAFSAMSGERIDALVVLASALMYEERKKIADLALKYKVAAIYGSAEYADAGALMSYAASYPELFRQAAIYVDRILKGGKPADMPIEQPTKFELIVNLRTAKALRLAIPQSLLLRADRVIQ